MEAGPIFRSLIFGAVFAEHSAPNINKMARVLAMLIHFMTDAPHNHLLITPNSERLLKSFSKCLRIYFKVRIIWIAS
ncbi:hypothetical protein D3C76_1641770 [compost metagenome]